MFPVTALVIKDKARLQLVALALKSAGKEYWNCMRLAHVRHFVRGAQGVRRRAFLVNTPLNNKLAI